MAPLEVTVAPVTSLDDRLVAEIVRLCSAALETDCGALFEYLTDSTHVLARRDERLVGHACWTTRRLQPGGGRPLRTAWVDAVTVEPAEQGQGIGSLVMRRLAAASGDYELRALGTERIAFYERLGWERWAGGAAAVLHDPLDTLMILRTATTPVLAIDRQITVA